MEVLGQDHVRRMTDNTAQTPWIASPETKHLSPLQLKHFVHYHILRTVSKTTSSQELVIAVISSLNDMSRGRKQGMGVHIRRQIHTLIGLAG